MSPTNRVSASKVQPGCTKPGRYPRRSSGVEKELTGRDSEPSELIYFKVYKSQIPVIEQAIETAALMLGSDKSRGYCLEMICADFLAGACLDGNNPEILLRSISRYYRILPSQQQEAFLSEVNRKASGRRSAARARDSDSMRTAIANCIGRCWSATAGDAKLAVACKTCRCTTSNSEASQAAMWNKI